MLNRLAKEYRERPRLKIADIGCAVGRFTRYIPFVSDGQKEMEIYCVDGVQQHIDGFRECIIPKTDEMVGRIPNVVFKLMCKLVQELPTTNSFGRTNYGTFDVLIYLNILHLMSYNDKEAALKHSFDLLTPGGVLLFSHTSKNTQVLMEGGDLGPGIYSYPLKFSRNRERLTSFILSNQMTCRLPVSANTSSSMDTSEGPVSFAVPSVPAAAAAVGDDPVSRLWKMRSPQESFYQDALVSQQNMRELLERSDVTELTFVTEVVTADSLRQKAEKAGFVVENVLRYHFDTPYDTAFGNTIPEARNHRSGISYLVVARKPL